MSDYQLTAKQAQKLFHKLIINYLAYDGPIFLRREEEEMASNEALK